MTRAATCKLRRRQLKQRVGKELHTSQKLSCRRRFRERIAADRKPCRKGRFGEFGKRITILALIYELKTVRLLHERKAIGPSRVHLDDLPAIAIETIENSEMSTASAKRSGRTDRRTVP